VDARFEDYIYHVENRKPEPGEEDRYYLGVCCNLANQLAARRKRLKNITLTDLQGDCKYFDPEVLCSLKVVGVHHFGVTYSESIFQAWYQVFIWTILSEESVAQKNACFQCRDRTTSSMLLIFELQHFQRIVLGKLKIPIFQNKSYFYSLIAFAMSSGVQFQGMCGASQFVSSIAEKLLPSLIESGSADIEKSLYLAMCRFIVIFSKTKCVSDEFTINEITAFISLVSLGCVDIQTSVLYSRELSGRGFNLKKVVKFLEENTVRIDDFFQLMNRDYLSDTDIYQFTGIKKSTQKNRNSDKRRRKRLKR